MRTWCIVSIYIRGTRRLYCSLSLWSRRGVHLHKNLSFSQLCGLNCFNNLYCRICALTWCMWALFTGKVSFQFTELCFESFVIHSCPHQGLDYQCFFSDFLSRHCLWGWSLTERGGSPSVGVNTRSLQSPMKVTRGPGGIADLVDRFRVLPRMPLVFLI